MALPSSGDLTFAQIQAEFGGATPPADLRSYLKNAGYVVGLGAKIDYAPNVPESGAITLRDFLGAAKNNLAVSLSATSVSGSRPCPPSGNATTDSVTCSVSGGSGSYTYQWYWDSGDTSFTIVSATSATTTFRRLVALDDNFTAYFFCTVTDTVTGFQNSTGFVTASVAGTAATAFSVSLSDYAPSAEVYASGTASVNVTATPSGGGGGNTYAWSKVSGTGGFTASGTTTATLSLSKTYGGAGSGSEYWMCTVTDQWGATAVNYTTVTLSCMAALSASASPSSVSGSTYTPGTATTGTATVTASGGSGGYSYSWAKVSGTTFTINASTSAATGFQKYYGSATSTETATYRCTVTDSQGHTATADVSVSLVAYGAPLSATRSPTSVYGSGTGTNITIYTASTTVTPSGGTAPYTYSWAKFGTIDASFDATSPTAATTTFHRHGAGGDTTYSQDWRCTVTDAASNTVTVDVYAQVDCTSE